MGERSYLPQLVVMGRGLLACQFAVIAAATEAAEDLWSRGTLTGDWGGARSRWQEQGVSLRLESTTFYQGALHSDGREAFDTGNRLDAHVDLDSQKLGLWAGGGLHMHLEYRDERMQNFRGGAIIPVNTGTMLPVATGNELEATAIYLNQRFGTNTSMLIGKLNSADLLGNDPFFGGRGTQRFWNMAFAAPPNGVIPPVVMGTLVHHAMGPYSLAAAIYDPVDRLRDYLPKGLFDEGLTWQLAAGWAGPLAERASRVVLSGAYSTRKGTDRSQLDVPPDERTAEKQGSYRFGLYFSHLLLESRQTPGKGLGFYGLASRTDGNPTAVRSSFSGGFAAHGMVPSRPSDSFGIGYFYYQSSNALASGLRSRLSLGDEQGAEVFYDLALTPWLRLGGDLQWIDPALSDRCDAFISGVRLRVIY